MRPEPGLPSPDPSTRRALSEWIETHQAQVWRYLRFLGCSDQRAADLAQDAFVAAIENRIDTLAPPAAAGWLRATARNLFRDDLRREGRRARLLEATFREAVAADAVFCHHAEPDGGDGYLTALRQCVALLPPRERQAIGLRYGEERPREQIGAVLGLAPEGVKSLLTRVRARLRRCVERRRAR